MSVRPLPYFESFGDLKHFLDTRGMFTMRMDIGKMEKVLNAIDLKSPPFFLIQVLGTNGKGSTSTFTGRILQSYGLRVGLYTSPHFLSFTERVLVQGQQLAREAWVRAGNILMQGGGGELSYFEFITCLSLLLFTEEKVDIAVMETGLGGTLDAVSTINNDLLVFTPIDLDHTHILGESIVSIAKDKAGAIRNSAPVLSGVQDARVQDVLIQAAQSKSAPLFFCLETENEQVYAHSSTSGLAHIQWPKTVEQKNTEKPLLGIRGSYQYQNAALALAAARATKQLFTRKKELRTLCFEEKNILEQSWNNRAELEGLNTAWIPGRAQEVSPIPPFTRQGRAFPHGLPHLILDGGHNPHALKNLSESLMQQGIRPIACIFTCLKDKDLDSMLAHLRILSGGPIFIPPMPDNPRAYSAPKLAQLCGNNAYPCASFEEALEKATLLAYERFPESFDVIGKKHPLLLCGSLYLLAEFYALFPDLLFSPLSKV